MPDTPSTSSFIGASHVGAIHDIRIDGVWYQVNAVQGRGLFVDFQVAPLKPTTSTRAWWSAGISERVEVRWASVHPSERPGRRERGR